MVETLWIILLLIVVGTAAFLAYLYFNQITQTQKTPNQGVVKHDWLATGRIDFATRLDDVNAQNKDRPREFRLLEYLMQHAEHVVTRAMLLEKVWDLNFDPHTNVVETHVSRLRSKVDKGHTRPLIHTIRGSGYCLRAPS